MAETDREPAFTCTDQLIEILASLPGSILISTYQAGRLVSVAVHEGQPSLSLHSFDHAMGVAVAPDRIAVGSVSQIWLLQGQHATAGRIVPAGRYDGCFVARLSHVTGEIRIHELAWVGRELWFVNTAFSCVCSMDPAHSFLPRWKPPFISALAAEDRCHLNGLALDNGVPRYVTCLAATDTLEGWREQKACGGCLLDIASGEIVARGFAMPHSPRVHDGRVFLLDSGQGRLVTVDPRSGRSETAAEVPGYARGMAFFGRHAFIGLSRLRPGRGFDGLPLGDRLDELKSGLAVVDLQTGGLAGLLEFTTGIHETFDVQFLPGIRRPAICGPFPSRDGSQPIWIVPESWMPATRRS